MPYNYKGDLYKREIVKKLQDVGLDVKSVNAREYPKVCVNLQTDVR